MRRLLLFIFLMVIMFIITSFCSKSAAPPEQEYLSGPYLGQEPPGNTPVKFAEGVISTTRLDFAINFTPDGKECFFTRDLNTYTIMTCKEVNGRWTDPATASFSGSYFEYESHISPDGERVYFGSQRPAPGSNPGEEFIWFSERTQTGWSEPQLLDPPFDSIPAMYVTVANNNSIYFTGPDEGDQAIFVSRYTGGQYQEPEKLSDNINYLQAPAHSFIAPDESYLIYDAVVSSNNYRDLFISFKNLDGTWAQSVNMGTVINTADNECMPFVTRDGNYMFFTRMGDIYWVDAGIIETLR